MKHRPMKILMAAFILISLLSIGPVLAIPDTPGNFQAESQANGNIYLSWDAVTGATSYEIYKASIDSIPGTPHDTVSGTTATLTIGGDGLVNGTTWYFWVKAVDGTGSSAPTSSESAICDASAPYGVNLTSPLNGSYVIINPPTFQWAATTDDNSAGVGDATGVDYYELQYSTTAGFTPSTTMTQSNITTTQFIPAALPNGTYYWHVRAVDVAGNKLDWTSGSVVVYSFIVNMAAPNLTAPANGSAFNDDPPGELPPTFSWTEVSGANGYLLEIDTQSPISATPEYSFNISGGTTTSYTPIVIFADDTFYWRVSATNGGGTSIGVYSDVWSFSVDQTPPDTPTLTSPANGSTTSDATPLLSWGNVADATEYELEISSSNTTNVDGSFSTKEYEYPTPGNDLTTNSHSPASALSDALHYWHVRAVDSAGNYSDWSAAWTFTVDTSLPDSPTLTTPADESTLNDSTPTLTWGAVTGATTYTLQISEIESFSSINITKTGLTATSYTLTAGEALDNDTYYWRVSSDLAPTQYSDVWSFTVDVEPSEQPVSFIVEVRAGATGDYLQDARVVITYGTTTIDVEDTAVNGRASMSAPPGNYTMTVEKNSWDGGSGTAFSKQITISASGEIIYANLYQSGYDILVATVRYNDKTGSTPPSIVIYRNGAVFNTVTLPKMPPTDMIPNNLKLAKTNLVIEVPSSGTYQIADPSYTEGKVAITNLSETMSSAYVNTVSLQITSSISGLVVDEAGTMIIGASVMLLRQSDNAIMGAVETSSIGFLFNLILPGSYYVRAQKTGYDTVTTSSFDVAPNETKSIGMVTLTQQKGTLNITVQSSGGQLLDNVNVEVSNASGDVVFTQLAAQGIVGTELPGGTYTITATKSGYVLDEAVSAVVVAGETASKTLVMTEQEEPPPEKGSIQISVKDANENPLQLVNVYIGGTKVGVTNQDGILLLEDMEPDTYSITLKKDGFEDVTFSQVVTAGEVATHTDSMDEVVVTEESSRMRWILIAAGAIILFAIVLVYLTKGRGKAEEGMEPVVREHRARPEEERIVERRPERTTFTAGRSGIPSTSKKTSGSADKEKRGGGIPNQSSR